jgi:phosphomannomutase
VVEALEKEFQKRRIPITLIKLEFCPTTASALPDSTHTIRAVLQHQADFGVTWNHDFSRCYMFDEHGQMVEHAAITCLLAQLFLQRYPQQTIVHRVNANRWQNNIKQQMQASNAIYASTDNSGHYFRHLAYCQSGMLPWLLIIELLSRSAKPLSVLAEGYSNNTLPINSTNRIAAQDASHWISVA